MTYENVLMMPKSVTLAILLLAACGSSPSTTVSDMPDGGFGADAMVALDGSQPSVDGSQPTGDAGEGSPDADTNCWETSPSELLTDPDNCGVCGHSCLGWACTDGVCESAVITSTFDLNDEIVSFTAGGLYVAWVVSSPASWEVWASYTDGSVPHRIYGPVSTGYPPDHIEIAGDYAYFPVDNGSYGSLQEIKLDGSGQGPNWIMDDVATGAATVVGTEMFWATETETVKKTTLGSGSGSIAYLNAGVIHKMKSDGSNMFYWTNDGLIRGPVVAPDPVSPSLSTIAPGEPTPFDFALSAAQVWWYDDSTLELLTVNKTGSTVTPAPIPSTGGIAIENAVAYTGNGELVIAHQSGGAPAVTIARLRFDTVAGDTPCFTRAVPRRIEVVGNYVYIAAEEETTCPEPGPTLGWKLYRAPKL